MKYEFFGVLGERGYSLFEFFTRRNSDGFPGSLEGYFDIDESNISGWVRKIPHFSNAGTIVQAVRGCDVLLESCAWEKRGTTRMPFLMEFENQFTTEELAREDVRLLVKNRRGDTGILLLEGSTRLELIRRYLGVPCDPVIDLDFSTNGNARQFMGAGWSGTEERFTWTIGKDSFLRIPAPLSPGAYILRIRYGTFLCDFVRTQPLELFLDDDSIASFNESDLTPQYRQLRFRWTRVSDPAVKWLRLHHPHAARPKDLGLGSDARELAFSFRTLSLGKERWA